MKNKGMCKVVPSREELRQAERARKDRNRESTLQPLYRQFVEYRVPQPFIDQLSRCEEYRAHKSLDVDKT